jgi:hypothetical protein
MKTAKMAAVRSYLVTLTRNLFTANDSSLGSVERCELAASPVDRVGSGPAPKVFTKMADLESFLTDKPELAVIRASAPNIRGDSAHHWDLLLSDKTAAAFD